VTQLGQGKDGVKEVTEPERKIVLSCNSCNEDNSLFC
jgi:hypothetical protein